MFQPTIDFGLATEGITKTFADLNAEALAKKDHELDRKRDLDADAKRI
jgi:hypothetical protein